MKLKKFGTPYLIILLGLFSLAIADNHFESSNKLEIKLSKKENQQQTTELQALKIINEK